MTETIGRRTLLAAGAVAVTSLSGCLQTDDNQSVGEAAPTAEKRPCTTAIPDQSHFVYIGESELSAVKQRVKDGEEPWATAYERLLADANYALQANPRSVTDDGAPKWDNPNQFGSDDSRHDYTAAMKMGSWVRDTGLAYQLTGENRYARKCIDLIRHWCLDPETKMEPNANIANKGVSIELLITIPKLWYGAALVSNHACWVQKNDCDMSSEFISWVREFVDSLPDPGYYQYNNIWAWRIATIAGAASFLDDEELFEKAVCMWRGKCETSAYGNDRPRPWGQYRSEDDSTGYLNRELEREDGLSYHIYGTKALMMTAEVASHRGVDLYEYNAPTDPASGPTLKKLHNFMAPYLTSPSSWEWGTGPEGVTDTDLNNAASLYELAYSRWGDESYLDVIESIGRPAYDIRLLGWSTLTHGSS